MGFFENRTPDLVKQWSETTCLVMDRGRFYVCKEVQPEELDLYRVLSEVESPYIAHVYGTDYVGESMRVIQEYVEGETLEEHLAHSGAMHENAVRTLVGELCDGLTALHAKGIVHRDLTPKNIVLTKEGHGKIIDFGISRMEKETASTDTEFLGTVGFAAPEQYGFRQTSARTDIYSLGVLMNYMLTKEFPNEQLTGGNLRSIIETCTKMDEADRYQSAESLKAALLEGELPRMSEKEVKHSKDEGLPGFRDGTLWKKFLAGIYYFCAVGIVLIGFFIPDYGFHGRLMIPIAFFLLFVAPILLLFNAWDWTGKLRLTKDKSESSQKTWKWALAIFSVIVALALIVIM